MLADWRVLASKILDSFDNCNLDKTEKLIMRDLLISRRKLHIDPEPQWASLSKIPLASGGVFDLTSAQIQGRHKGKFKELAFFSKHIVALLASLFSSNPKKNHGLNEITLFFSDGFSDLSRPLFQEFIHEERFRLILSDSKLIIQDRRIWGHKKIGDSIYVKDIGLYLFLVLFNRREKASLIVKSCRELMDFRKLKHFRYLGITKFVIERNLWQKILSRTEKTNLMATNSFMEILPTPFYIVPNANTTRYLLWYSNNNFSIPSQEGIDVSDNRIDFSCRSEVDVHLVWTSDFANSIHSRNSEVEIRVVGSLMMYPKRAIKPLEGFFKIVLFDMTPWEGYPPRMFGSEIFMKSFVQNIIEVSQEFPNSRVYLKPKRKFVRVGSPYIHSASYLALIDELSSIGLLGLLDPSTNIYGLCDEADLILGFPFASPAIIGHELSKPSFYFNPEVSKDWLIRKSMDNVSVISGKENLRLKIREIYNSKNS